MRSPTEQSTTGMPLRFGIAADATAETARHAHQMRVVQCLIRPGQRPPPQTESARVMPHPEIRIQHDPIHAVVAAGQQILIESAQPIGHEGHGTSSAGLDFKLPRRALFRSAVCEKA